MLFLSITQDYFLWHYSRAFSEIYHVWFNFLWFIVHFFSIPQLMGSWFAPWKRMTEERGETWDMEDLANFIVIGMLSRLVGFIIRTTMIFAGLFMLLATSIFGFVVYVFWVAAPVVILAFLGFGLALVISSIVTL